MGDKQRILVVDDNASFSQLIQCVLEEEFEVALADDGFEGVKLAGSLKPDLILMDVMMPRMSGIEMVRMLQEDPEMKTIPVIVLTGSHMDASIRDLFEQESNVRLFLSKVTPVAAIVEAARRTMSEQKASASLN
ncbi:MAG: response regulator [Elusimicrobiales bacterium]|jgi:two-component system cell cycle response regulator DivK